MSKTSKQPEPIDQLMRACEHCEKPESLASPKLLICAGCHHVNYCNKECQKSDWQMHQAQCKMNRVASARLREEKERDKLEGQINGPSSVIIRKYLDPFLKIHTAALERAFPQALNLHTKPSNIDIFVLTINLTPTFTKKPPPSADPAKLFRLASTRLSTLDEAIRVFAPDDETAGLMHQGAEEVKTFSAEVKAEGGIGVGQMFISCTSIVHTRTFFIQDLGSAMSVDRNWERTLADALEKGLRL